MKRAAHASIASSAGTLIGHLTLATTCVALMAACSASGHSRHVAATASSTLGTNTSATATTTTTPLRTYRVKRGDSLTKIASHFRVSISAIATRNQIANRDRLSEGQTLLIPPAPPHKLIVTPPEGPPGQAFRLELTGAVPSETIHFEIDSAADKYTGGQHVASADGAVTAIYQTALAARAGICNVTATGSAGTIVRAEFVVVASATTPHT
jgi:LysM repeat protein